MSPVVKKKVIKKEDSIEIRIGNKLLEVKPLSADEVAKANARIQKKVQPVINQIKKTRRAASITASKIILNA